MITNYGGKLSACIKACREGGRVRAAFLKREAREGVERRENDEISWKKFFLLVLSVPEHQGLIQAYPANSAVLSSKNKLITLCAALPLQINLHC